jgi:hypothetical protein
VSQGSLAKVAKSKRLLAIRCLTLVVEWFTGFHLVVLLSIPAPTTHSLFHDAYAALLALLWFWWPAGRARVVYVSDDGHAILALNSTPTTCGNREQNRWSRHGDWRFFGPHIHYSPVCEKKTWSTTNTPGRAPVCTFHLVSCKTTNSGTVEQKSK